VDEPLSTVSRTLKIQKPNYFKIENSENCIATVVIVGKRALAKQQKNFLPTEVTDFYYAIYC